MPGHDNHLFTQILEGRLTQKFHAIICTVAVVEGTILFEDSIVRIKFNI